ncbi:hypothetical protein AJ78_06536 [Emergomyces pasteurianus Ep9510]|uniref:Uncharacterized protein n=1 Tax=Emergomyces pasteurianus Ep9510 TaxID=1447872 RepID=A0A1J9QAJ8_9EURO|nr:hypothetical protein AJ78_06536 [Emergomyces pasteurianus Ep9510]
MRTCNPTKLRGKSRIPTWLMNKGFIDSVKEYLRKAENLSTTYELVTEITATANAQNPQALKATTKQRASNGHREIPGKLDEPDPTKKARRSTTEEVKKRLG